MVEAATRDWAAPLDESAPRGVLQGWACDVEQVAAGA
jgi:hypothetical protein